MRQCFVEGGKRGVGVADPAKARGAPGQFRQHLAARGRSDRRAPAKMPAANGLSRGFRTLKASRLRYERRWIVGDSGENRLPEAAASRAGASSNRCA